MQFCMFFLRIHFHSKKQKKKKYEKLRDGVNSEHENFSCKLKERLAVEICGWQTSMSMI
jgi:hypothetical protein